MFFGRFLKTSNGCLIHRFIKLSNVIRSTRSMRLKRRPMTKKMCFMIIAQVGWNQFAIFPRFSIASCEASMNSKIFRSSFLYKDKTQVTPTWEIRDWLMQMIPAVGYARSLRASFDTTLLHSIHCWNANNNLYCLPFIRQVLFKSYIPAFHRLWTRWKLIILIW